MDPREFYELAKEPPAALIADYPWLQRVLRDLPEGTKPSLEGFLWPDTYRVLPDTTPEELIRLMLDGFIANVGEAKLTVPAERGLTFYQVLALASIVEREAVVNEERPLIAGVYQNRIDGIPGIKNKILNADPTVIYAVDTVKLSEIEFDTWKGYTFWKVPEGISMKDIVLPDDLKGFQTYTQPGLIPAPIVTPTIASIDAALHPDTADKYIYFLAVPGTSNHVFAKTDKEHNANRKKYGYT